MCLKFYYSDPAIILSALGLAQQAALKKPEVKIDLLTDIDTLLMVKKDIRGRISQAIYRNAKANNKYMKDYDKHKESPYLKYWGVNDLYGWATSQKPVNKFKWIEDTPQFNKDFIKNYNEESDEGYFPEIYVQNPEKLHKPHNDLPFLPKSMKIEKVKNILLIYMIKLNMSFT